MAVRVADTIKPMGAGGYPVAMAEDIQVSSTDTRTVKKALEELGGTNASTTVAGVVKINDDGLDIATDGTLSLDIATDTTIGGVIAGDNLTIDSDGKLGVDTDNIYLKSDTYSKNETDNAIRSAIGSFTVGAVGTTGIDENRVSNETPVGTVIAHMGNTAPEHYLICDGSVYNIADYKELADFFIKEFGSVNKFGGDGTTTFAVPDLQGEFLRGTGTNSHADQGSGAEVGEHQDGTKHSWVDYNAQGNVNFGNGGISPINADKLLNQSSGSRYISTSSYTSKLWKNYTSRPTNTSVLYCIKYESTYYLSVNHEDSYVSEYYDNYSEDEVIIGKWIDGKPIYRKVINTKMSSSSYTDINVASLNRDIVINAYCFIHNATDGTYDGYYEYFPNPVNGANRLLWYDRDFATPAQKNTIRLANTATGYYNKAVTLILEYTKTTDAVNSFKPQMIYDSFTLGELDNNVTAKDIKDIFGQ